MEKKKKTRMLPQIAAEKIIAYIKDNRLEPGDKLPTETQLSELLEVGRGTVREAIGSLVSRNVLEVRQGAGTFVSHKNGVPEDPLGLELEDADLALAMDMMEVRLILEPEIAFMAALNATDEQIEQLEKQCILVENLIKENQNYSDQDVLFHQLLGECSGNLVIRKLVPVITSSVHLNVDVTRDRYKMETIHQHGSIVSAIKKRDPYGAKYHMLSHLNLSRTGIAEAMESEPEPSETVRP